MWPLLLSFVLLASCGVDPGEPIDERDAEFSLAKDDGSPFSPAERAGALALVNTAATSVLDEDVPLDVRAAEGIVAHRDGSDGLHGTADDNAFDDLAELDAIPYVGPKALERLVAYADALGLIAH